jgi:hypothetical protein
MRPAPELAHRYSWAMSPVAPNESQALGHAWERHRDSSLASASESELAATQTAFVAGARAAYGLLYVLFHLAEDLDGVSSAFEMVGAELGLDADSGAVPASGD